MSAYVVAEIEVTDQATYDEYRKQVMPALQKYGGKFLVRGGKVVPLEGGWNPKRVVVVEFASAAKALEWYNSPEYAPAKALRQKASTSKQIIVEGA
jgi:uncharacterized protein (DUF1330 family)